MFPGGKENHKEAIVQRMDEVDSINESLYVQGTAPSGSQSLLQPQLNVAQTERMMCILVEQGGGLCSVTQSF